MMLRMSNSPSFSAKLKLGQATYVLWGVLLLFLTAQISIPLEPVPITLQTFGVMLLGLTFDRKSAVRSILAYLGLGAVGVPVFANFHGGLPVFLGTTGGYLIGFLVAVLVMTSLKKYLNNENFFHIAFNCLIGTMIIFVCGIGRLAHFVGFKEAINLGFMPFIIPGLIKVVLLALSVRYIKFGQILTKND